MRLSFKPNVTCRPTRKLVVCDLNVQTSKQRGKNGSLSGPPGGRGPYHGAIGTVVNLALAGSVEK